MILFWVWLILISVWIMYQLHEYLFLYLMFDWFKSENLSLITEIKTKERILYRFLTVTIGEIKSLLVYLQGTTIRTSLDSDQTWSPFTSIILINLTRSDHEWIHLGIHDQIVLYMTAWKSRWIIFSSSVFLIYWSLFAREKSFIRMLCNLSCHWI